MLKKNFSPLAQTNLFFAAAKSQKGFSLIELLVVMVIIGIIVSIAIPNLLASRRAANEGSAVAAMRSIYSGEAVYYFSYGNGSYGTLTDLRNAGIIDSVLGAAPHTKSNYIFNVNVLTLQKGYDVTARPQSHILTQPLIGAGTRDFGMNETGMIYQTTNATTVTFNATTRLAQAPATPIQ